MCKSIHFLIYITNPYVFVSLLATTGAASVTQMRRVSFEFLKIRYCFSLMRFFLSIFIMVFSFDTLLRLKYFDTLLRLKYVNPNLHKKSLCFFLTIGDDGSRQCASVSPIFVRVFEIQILCFSYAKIVIDFYNVFFV